MNTLYRKFNSISFTLFFSRKMTTASALVAFLIIAFQIPIQAQTANTQTKPTYSQPSFWLGASAGANFNFYRGSTQQLNSDFTAPAALGDGYGVGLFLAPSIEYYHPNSLLGIIFQIGYDSRKGQFDEALSPCDNPMDLSTSLSYLTVEPSLRFSPRGSNFYLYAGPRLAFLLDRSFEYQLKANPDFVDQEPGPMIEGDFGDANRTILSMQIGTGYDIPLSEHGNMTQLVLSPFVAFQPYFGQDPRSVETWNITSLRVGATLKFGTGKLNPTDHSIFTPPITTERRTANFAVNAPRNITGERTVRETFPLLNYVFFDTASTELSERYILLNQNEVKDFKEDQIEFNEQESISGRSDRQMQVYYNVLNILGDRMLKDLSSDIRLIGSFEKDSMEGHQMARSIKSYLVEVFEIDSSRITTMSMESPNITAEESRSANELALLRAEGRRVTIESDSPGLLMEFQRGSDASLKPVRFLNVQNSPVESYVTFTNGVGNEEFTSWNMEIEDSDGQTKYYGPFTQQEVAIPGKSIMGSRNEGDYHVKMVGTTKDGRRIAEESQVNMVLWAPPETEEVMRFSITYGFDESDAVERYDTYLEEVVMPKIQQGGKVIIHGYTDEIGDASHNQTLSLARANDVKNTLQQAMSHERRSDVQFITYGFGEDSRLSPFKNKHPEGRFYNRAVIIDIVPK